MQRFTTLLCLLAMSLLARGIAAAGEQGFKPIFDGKTPRRLGRRSQAVERRRRRHHRPDHR